MLGGVNQNAIPSQDTKQSLGENNISSQNDLDDDIPF